MKKPGSRKAKKRRGLLHHGLDRERLESERGDLEKAFADAWEEQNKERYRGCGILQLLMLQYRDGHPFTASRAAFWITQREAVIAATVIQWLGTNVGFAFLAEALRKCGYEIREMPPPPPEPIDPEPAPVRGIRFFRKFLRRIEK